MTTRFRPILLAIGFATLLAVNSYAQPLVNIETVTVGDSGNAGDTVVAIWHGTTGYGAVPYNFAIGKYEVTISQYTAFLNSAASVTSDSYLLDLWNANMSSDSDIAGISRKGSGTVDDPYIYSVIGPSGIAPAGASSPGNRPISYVSWFDAARFANWVNNGATNGASTETGAYTLNGATAGIVLKNPDAGWWIPSEDEWYKAAYYKGGGANAGYWIYPTQSDSPPNNTIGSSPNRANFFDAYDFTVTQSTYSSGQNYLTEAGAFGGSPGSYGTFDQGGNLWEWNDAVIGSLRGVRGASWNDLSVLLMSEHRQNAAPSLDSYEVGFRLATVPEPSTYALLLMTATATLWHLRRRR